MAFFRQHLSFIIFYQYDFGYIVDAARLAKDEGVPFVGLKVENNTIEKSQVGDSVLKRSFTPGEVKKLIQDNIEYLVEKDYGGTFVSPHVDILFTALDDMQDRANQHPDLERPLVIEEFDDQFQKQEVREYYSYNVFSHIRNQSS